MVVNENIYTIHLIFELFIGKYIQKFLVTQLLLISKIALVIIKNGARWLVENFVLSRYNNR